MADKAGMDCKQLDLFDKNIRTFVKAFECVGGSPTALLEQYMSFLETAARNGLELQFTLHTGVGH